MFDSRSPWYSGGLSRTNLDAGSSASLLHSIYGSQASQLPFSDCESDADLLATKSDYLPPNLRSSSPVLPQRRLARPKSSPACVIEARERQRRQMTAGKHEDTVPVRRPGSAMPRQRPGTASRGKSRIARGRPTSAAGSRGQRPSSAAPSHFAGGGGASPKRTRPKTAMGVRSSSSSTVLLDLEEVEEEEGELAPIIRDTPPVQLTHTPEYFNFWEGKPLLRREFGVKVHKRRQWQRPKSDYGSRFLTRSKKGDGEEGSGLLGSGLDTLLERSDGSELGSGSGTRRGSRDFGALGDGGDGAGGRGNDASKLSVSGEGVDSRSGSRRGSKDFGGKGRGKEDRWRRTSDDRNKSSRNLNRFDKSSDWDTKDGSADADQDDYFKKSDEMESLTTFLPNLGDSNRGPSSLVQGSLDDLLSGLDKENEENKQNLNRKPSSTLERERERASRLRPLTDLTDNSNQITKLPDIVNSQPYAQKALANASWMDGDGSGSAHTTRFELPMDMKTLEGMSPVQYLRKHCIISRRRMAHCKKIFIKQDKDKDAQINREELISGLTDAHHNCITTDQANSVLELVQMADEAHVDGKLFAALCCLTERALNLNYLPLARKEVIEVVDFEALDWKLRDCHISNQLRTLFTQL